MTQETILKNLETFKSCATDAHTLSMGITDLAEVYAETAMVIEYIRARYPQAYQEAQLFVEKHNQERGEAKSG
jgi:hypothetical protein